MRHKKVAEERMQARSSDEMLFLAPPIPYRAESRDTVMKDGTCLSQEGSPNPSSGETESTESCPDSSFALVLRPNSTCHALRDNR